MSNTQVIGIDFGGTSIKMAVVAGDDLLTETFRIETQEHVGPDSLIDVIAEKVAAIRKDFPDVAAVGIGVPGAIDFKNGITYNLTNVEGWSDVPLRDIMAKKTGLPTQMENDANCMAYAEWKYGAGQGFTNVICVTLGTGVGGGLILNGQLYRGSQYAAGEIGQMSIDYNGVEGPYGNTGALERYIGNRQISEHAAKLFKNATEDAPADLSPEKLAELAGKGDPVAIELWKDVAKFLGSCLMSTIYLLNPDAIVIGGGVAHAGDVLFDPLKNYLHDTLTDECFDHLEIVRAKFGNTAGMIGSSALAAELLED